MIKINIVMESDRISPAEQLGQGPRPLRVYYRKRVRNAEGLGKRIEASGTRQLEKMIKEEVMQLEEITLDREQGIKVTAEEGFVYRAVSIS